MKGPPPIWRGSSLKMSRDLCGRSRQRLIQIGDDVCCILGPDRDADHVRGCACRNLLLFAQLTVRGRGRVDDQRPRVAKVGHVLNSFRLLTSFTQAS